MGRLAVGCSAVRSAVAGWVEVGAIKIGGLATGLSLQTQWTSG